MLERTLVCALACVLVCALACMLALTVAYTLACKAIELLILLDHFVR